MHPSHVHLHLILEPEEVAYFYFRSVSRDMTHVEKAKRTASGLRRAPDEFYDQRLQCRQWNQISPALGRFHQASGAEYPLVNDHEDGSGLKRLLRNRTICEICTYLMNV